MAKSAQTMLSKMLSRANEIQERKRNPSSLDAHPLRAEIIQCFHQGVSAHKMTIILEEEGHPLPSKRLQEYRRQVLKGLIK